MDELEKLKTIGLWRYPQKKFVYEKAILIKPTNLFGNTYFSNYIEWQGETRESFFLCHPAAGVFLQRNPHLMLVTQALHHRFINNAYFGDRVSIELTTSDILSYSLRLIFRYFKQSNREKVGEGWQKICFFDRVANMPCKVPPFFMDLALSIKEE